MNLFEIVVVKGKGQTTSISW